MHSAHTHADGMLYPHSLGRAGMMMLFDEVVLNENIPSITIDVIGSVFYSRSLILYGLSTFFV